MQYSLSMWAVVVVLVLTACDIGEGPAEQAGKEIDQAAENVGAIVNGSEDKAYQRLKDRGDHLERAPKYLM
ncbi:MAG: hypothetical protein WA970_12800 [Gammaproteobacteria bacterium]